MWTRRRLAGLTTGLAALAPLSAMALSERPATPDELDDLARSCTRAPEHRPVLRADDGLLRCAVCGCVQPG